LSLEKYAIDPIKIESGIVQIKKRTQRLDIYMICTGTIFLASMVALFLQQDFVYGFFGLTIELKQLHIPVSADGNLANLHAQPDYFMNLLSWFGWFILKLFVSFIGSFFIIRFIKRFQFFARRFKSFILKFVAWLIAFILLWSVLTYIQYERKDKDLQAYAKVIAYDQDLQQSELAQYLKTTTLDSTVQAYLLAQVALLHQPVDKDAAIPYILDLINSEKNNSEFFQYGFKPEQLWTMQYQTYGKALTPMAETVEKQVLQANRISKLVQYFIIVIGIFSVGLTILIFLLSWNLKKRIGRIEKNLF